MTLPTLNATASNPFFQELDALVLDLRNAEAMAKQYNDAVDSKKIVIINLVEKFGVMPPRAERSHRLETTRFSVTVSRSESVSINVTSVGVLYSRLRAAGCAPLFKKLFRVEQKYSIHPGARDFVDAGKLPAKAPRNLKQLFAACISGKTGNPRLSIDDLQAKSAKKSKQKGPAA